MAESDKVVLGLHTVHERDGGINQGLSGHAWITVNQGGKTTTYGAWPDEHEWVQRNHQEKGWNGSGTDVRVNLEQRLKPAESRYYELTPEEMAKLHTRLNEPCKWTHLHNCSSWAVETTEQVTGEKVGSRDPRLGYISQTPSSLGDRINELERRDRTDLGTPLPPADRDRPESSLQSSLHSAPHSSSEAPPASSRALSDFVRPSGAGASATSEKAASPERAARPASQSSNERHR